MKISERFNDLSGKIVNVGELGAELAKNGLPADYELSRTKVLEKVESLTDEDFALLEELNGNENVTSVAYISLAAVEAAEAAALKHQNENMLMAVWSAKLSEVKRNDLYLEIEKIAQMVGIFEDEATIDAFHRAALAAPDRRDMVARNEILNMGQATERLLVKLDNRGP